MNGAGVRIIRVARDRDLFEQIGKDIHFDLVDHDRVRAFHFERLAVFSLFKEHIAREFGIPVQFQRFWTWAKRPNHTYRPHAPITPEEELKRVEFVNKIPGKMNSELHLFLEVELGPLYDPEKGELRYVGRLFVKSYAKPTDILREVNKMAGFGPYEEVDLYKEIKFKPSAMCKLVDRTLSFRANWFEDGDIICFQKTLGQDAESYRYPTIPSFLEHTLDCQETEGQHHPSERFTWKISNFSKLASMEYYSEAFTVAGNRWHVMIFPKGNKIDYISIYLHVAGHFYFHIGWSRTVGFSLTVVNQACGDFSVTKETSHKFTEFEHDWCFTSFMPLTELHDRTKGYLAQDTLVY